MLVPTDHHDGMPLGPDFSKYRCIGAANQR
jgi:hypothetical protein